jgi:catechol 2,3-dioxygenase-like lactoylglutathione lyase family enzyme
MPLREFFHLMLMVDDIDAADQFFDSLFSPVCYMEKSWSDFDKRWASLNRVGNDFVLELMEASRAPEDRAAPLPKFAARFHQHLHSFAWLVDEADLRPLFQDLRKDGVRIAKPAGGLFDTEPDELPSVIFTHPKDTYGQMEFMACPPEGHPRDPLFGAGWSAAFWSDEHPLGIRRTSRMTNVVRDVDGALPLFTGPLGGTVFHRQTTDLAESAFVMVGSDSVIELARPVASDSMLARDLTENGEIPHAVHFLVKDLDPVERHVEKLGVRIAERRAGAIVLDPRDTFNAVIGFTDEELPGDPRAAAN